MENQVSITVDGRQLLAPKGTMLWEVCRSYGIDIPIFCYHTKLGAVGACRTCLVQLEGAAKGPITACSTPVSDGMVVHTRSPVVQKAQRAVFEFLLLNHPLDCPICDRGGECPLQDQVFAFGPGTSRYVEPKRHQVKPIPLGPTIELDRERCVLCWRCVRFCADVAEDKSIILLDRADHTSVGTFQSEPYISNFSGNVIELCPVGALTSRKQRFKFRPWELQNRPSICPHCPVGCNINISVRKNDEVIRFLSRDNPEVDDGWLCDRGRFNYDFISSAERLKSPLIRRDGAFVEVSWSEALGFIAERIRGIVDEHGPDSVAGIASPRLTNEDLLVFKKFMRDVVGSRLADHFPRADVLSRQDYAETLKKLDERVMPIAGLESAKTILVVGADPSIREPVLELRIRKAVNQRGAKLVLMTSGDAALTPKAHAVITATAAQLPATIRSLTAAIVTARKRNVSENPPATAGNSPPDLNQVAAWYLSAGQVAVVYDDTFPVVPDKGDALEAVAALIDALSAVGEVGVLPMLGDCNSMGARDLRVLPEPTKNGHFADGVVSMLEVTDSPIRAVFMIGANPAADHNPAGDHNLVGADVLVRPPRRPGLETLRRNLENLDLLVVQELTMTETASLAHVILPATSFAEKTGSFTNTERRIQAIEPVVPAPGIARSDWEILVDLSQYFESPLGYTSPEHIWDDLTDEAPAYRGLSYIDIGPRGLRPGVLQPA
jgi:NADH-quinone oxidoreductase subunit G